MDPMPFESMLGAVDTLVVWDYTDLSTSLPLPQDKPIHLIAWSMGVWAATQVLAEVPLASATAVNGTPTPIDNTAGIPEAIFDGTLAGLNEAGLARFRRRMCGGGEALKAFMASAPQRSLEDLTQELATLGQTIRALPSKPFTWTRAYGATEDRIFPVGAQRTAFPELIEIPGAHWVPQHFAQLLGGVSA